MIPADVVVIAMGPWSGEAASSWGLPVPRITGQKAHSIIIQPEYVSGPAAALNPKLANPKP